MGHAQEIILTNNNTSNYKIAVPADATKLEQRSAEVLQRYIHTISGTQLPIVTDTKAGSPSIFIGHTFKADRLEPGKMKPESYLLATTGKDIVICGGSGKGLIYGVYRLLERYMGCKKLSNGAAAIVPSIKQIKIPGIIHEEYHPPFEYRESYYPASNDGEYLEWNQLHKLDDLWGVWGHSYNKLVPAKTYFTEHPEYYALVKGKRQPSQLCLSNDNVFKIVVAELKKRMAQNPDAIYWSISPNDDNGYCECDKCRATDNEQGSHAGSLIKFVNRVAAVFPDKKFTTLAYGYTHKAPATLKPSDNVYVFLSDIDAYRDKPLEQEPTAAPFRADLKAWWALTGNIFVWDYVTEFTNYLAPFPNFNTLQPNMLYMKNNGVKGIFAQGSGDTYSEWAELRSYVLAKLFEDPEANAQTIISSYLKDYYGPAASYLQEYLDLLQQQMAASKRKLDIYGDPVNEWKTYLSPELLDRYSTLFDKAEGAVEDNPTLSERVMRARLPLEYTVLQQARFYGIEKHGIFIQSDGRWSVKPKFDEKVSRFTANCKKAGVSELSEGGANPDQYQTEWNTIFKNGVTPSKAVGANVTLQYAFSDDYPAKGPHTLTDGNPGYGDYSYNWLCFYGVPMIATIDLGKTQKISDVRMHFLDDPRHRIFLPANILVETSADGINYHKAGNTNSANTAEHYETTVKEFSFPTSTTARYIRVTANDLPTLPDWRAADNKKPMIACDEIYVQ
jgi:Domain of unknown function (DUF4838)/F5/8 type C domain/Glycosyl hydrolase family 20, domain 2